ncbi:collagen triple helix repeat-containing protein [Streptomyces laurentii]|uniref:Collagen triple helix repeat-containing protein n=1 Tax=Streptomyces laurentii TaxID=39478 RepID=A0A160P5B2_STRLU|nr:collagen triple helix repeat-containing protein [Streptomyces laurentii]
MPGAGPGTRGTGRAGAPGAAEQDEDGDTGEQRVQGRQLVRPGGEDRRGHGHVPGGPQGRRDARDPVSGEQQSRRHAERPGGPGAGEGEARGGQEQQDEDGVQPAGRYGERGQQHGARAGEAGDRELGRQQPGQPQLPAGQGQSGDQAQHAGGGRGPAAGAAGGAGLAEAVDAAARRGGHHEAGGEPEAQDGRDQGLGAGGPQAGQPQRDREHADDGEHGCGERGAEGRDGGGRVGDEQERVDERGGGEVVADGVAVADPDAEEAVGGAEDGEVPQQPDDDDEGEGRA